MNIKNLEERINNLEHKINNLIEALEPLLYDKEIDKKWLAFSITDCNTYEIFSKKLRYFIDNKDKINRNTLKDIKDDIQKETNLNLSLEQVVIIVDGFRKLDFIAAKLILDEYEKSL